MCVDVGLWMRSNWLQLNMAKTYVPWCSSSPRQHQIPDEPFRVGSDLVQPVRHLDINLESDLSMNTHITRPVACCFAVLRQIGSISQSVNLSCIRSSCHWSYHGWTMLAGLPEGQLDILQSVLNTVARLIYRSRKFDHVTPLLVANP